jgi:hypothetical protein
MTQTIRQRRYKRTSDKAEYGNKPHILDRRKKALALRAQGYSYRAIAAELGYDLACAFRDCNQAVELLTEDLSAETVKVELLQVLRLATGALVQDIEHQQQHGQIEELRDSDGQLKGAKIKRTLNPATVSELGKTVGRIAVLLGIQDTSPDEQIAATSNTSITLIAPGDAAAFGQRAQQLAQARQEAIDVESVPAPPAGPLQGQPGATEQPLSWRESRARRKAQEAAAAPIEPDPSTDSAERPTGAAGGRSGRYRSRFLPAPLRN